MMILKLSVSSGPAINGDDVRNSKSPESPSARTCAANTSASTMVHSHEEDLIVLIRYEALVHDHPMTYEKLKTTRDEIRTKTVFHPLQ